jgi:transposase
MNLQLSRWRVVSVAERPDEYFVEATHAPPTLCVHCGSADGVRGFGTRRQTLIDAPRNGRHVRIRLRRTRHICRECGRTFLQPLAGVADSGSMTARCVAYVERQSEKHTFSHIARLVGINEKTVRNILKRRQ